MVMVSWLIAKFGMILLILSLIISSVHVATSSDTPIYSKDSCSGKTADSLSSVFKANLNDTLLNKLLPEASQRGFFNFTNGTGVDLVGALYYCRGDVDPKMCGECVQAAMSKITDVCKSRKEGIVWFEECTLRYANRVIFGVNETEPNYRYGNYSGNVTEVLLNPIQETFHSTMKDLIEQAAYNNLTPPRRFAIRNFSISSTQILRGLAQCTPDLDGPQCYDCLSAALKLRNTWADTIVFLPSCMFRYDVYGPVAPSPPPPPPISLPVWKIILIAVSSVVFILLIVFGGCWLRKCCSEVEEPGPGPDVPIVPIPIINNEGFRKYTYPQLEQMTDGFTKQIGKGAYGDVYHGRLLDGSREVAVKVLNEKDAPKQFSNEIDVFGRISHKNLVSLLGYCQDGNKLGLIYEFMDKQDLRAHMSGSLSWIKRLEIAIGTAEGLNYLHNHCEELIVHRDVKPDNILLTGEGELLQPKVADFGLCKIFPAADVTTIETRVIGTHGYTAPEYHSTGLLNEKADVYSFGVVLLELITGVSPHVGFDFIAYFETMFNTADIEKILDRKITRDVNYGSVWGATELARQCVETDQKKRPVMWEIVVKLKQCLDMEVNKNAPISSTGTSSAVMMTAVTSSAITMVPEAR